MRKNPLLHPYAIFFALGVVFGMFLMVLMGYAP